MEDPKDSLIIEFLGLKATALGTLPVSGLLLIFAVAVLTICVVGPGQITRWAKRLAKPTDE